MDQWLIIWAILAVATFIIELMTAGLTSIWLTGGAIVALVLNRLEAPWGVQVAAFFVVSFILVLATRPLAKKYINDRKVPTNYEDAIGKDVRITQRIDNSREEGRAFYNGVDWAAKSSVDGITFEPEEMAKVVAVEGVKLIVEKIS